ncbi:MAG: tyrosine-type recombinase/integrase [Acidobacteria bacterium]|nr:tyrosine-type recombinase/integrase [Acidobacteriota bacterium]
MEAFRASRKHISANTSLKELQCLRTYFGFGISRGWCASNPAKAIKPPKSRPNEVVPYTPEQIAAILAASQHIGRTSYERLRARTMLLILRHTGLRISDALMLRKDQVRDGTFMLFTRKTGGHVLLPVPAELQDSLDRLPLPIGEESDTGYYFWNSHSTMKRLVNGAERLLQAVFKKSGVPDGHAHRFRHTLAIRILATGGTIENVARILGNTPAIAYQHYAPWCSRYQVRAREIIGRAYADDTGLLHRSDTKKKGIVIQ